MSLGKTILVVEDEPAVRDVIGTVLRLEGYTVLEAATAAEALAVCPQHQGVIHLALVDVNLPDGGGDQLAGQLARALPGLKVLLTSGGGVPNSAHPCLGKPFRPDTLLQRVGEMLGREGESQRRSEGRPEGGSAVVRPLPVGLA
jgi:DNA-binding response OmpR family regulator